jgi:glycyl-tRNA synthetase beta chain
MLKGGDYTGAMRALAGLRESIDAFFDTVKVMDDDDAVRRNRLALLNAIGGLFLATADISKLQG